MVACAESSVEPACEAWNTDEYFQTATPEGVKECLDAGVDVMARFDDVYGRDDGATPLHFAARSNTSSGTPIDAGACGSVE